MQENVRLMVYALTRILHEGGRQAHCFINDNKTLYRLSTLQVRIHFVPIRFQIKSRCASCTIPLEP